MNTRYANSGKELDEACNHNNDAYRDEALYAEWTNPPQASPDPQRHRAPTVFTSASPDTNAALHASYALPA